MTVSKLSTAFALFFLLSVPSTGFCGADTLRLGRTIARETEPTPARAMREVILCVRGLIDRKVSGARGVAEAADLLKIAQDHSGDLDLLKKLKLVCEEVALDEKPAPVSRDEQFAAAQALRDLPCSTRAMVEDFVRPHVVCAKGGLAATAGLILGFGAKVDGASCRATDGRRWLEVSLGVGIGVAVGGEIDVNGGTLDRGRHNYSRIPASFSDSMIISQAQVFAQKSEETGREPNDSHDSPVKGYGVGLAGSMIVMGQANVEVLPLGSDAGYLATRLQRREGEACADLARRSQKSESWESAERVDDTTVAAPHAERDDDDRAAKSYREASAGDAPVATGAGQRDTN